MTIGAVVCSGVSGATPTVRFAFSQTPISAKQAAGFAAGDTNESFPVVYCPWPDGKTSITAAEARALKCLPAGTKFPVASGRTWFLLASPIGGAKFAVQNGNLSDDIRFVHASTVPGVMSVGPVLMQYGDYSGGARPSLVSRGSSIWIYDYRTERGPEVLRISTSTGGVLQRTTMPAISRPVCAVNRYGFWMGQAGNSLYPHNVRLGIWYAPLGAHHGVLVRRTNDFLLGFASHDRAVDVRVETRPGADGTTKAYLWRFTPIRQ